MVDDTNYMLFVIDTLRADHLGCYGYFRDTSPNIDRLAAEGVRFKGHHATAISTGPGFTSIITGLSPIHHHFYLTPWNLPNIIDFDDAIPTIPELIQDLVGGYTTSAFDNLINFSSHMDQFVRGFEYYVNVTRTSKPVHHHVTGDQINNRLIPWLKGNGGDKFFAFIHYWDPHTPYNQPDDYREIFKHKPGDISDLKVEKAPAGYSYVPGWGKVGELWEPDPKEGKPTLDLYDGEIHYVDHLIGDVVETLKDMGIADNTVIILTSDHGEQLGQHGLYDHSGLHESVVYVPLIMWAPSMLPRGKTIEGYVQQADITPTILSLLGAKGEALPAFDGKDLLPAIKDGVSMRNEIYIENHEQRAVIQGRWKYIRNYFDRTEQLYDMKGDPMEIVNLATKEGGMMAQMRGKLIRWVNDNLGDKPDPMWNQVAHYSSRWASAFKEDYPDLKPTLVQGIDF